MSRISIAKLRKSRWLIVVISNSDNQRRAEQLKHVFPQRKVSLCDPEGNEIKASDQLSAASSVPSR